MHSFERPELWSHARSPRFSAAHLCLVHGTSLGGLRITKDEDEYDTGLRRLAASQNQAPKRKTKIKIEDHKTDCASWPDSSHALGWRTRRPSISPNGQQARGAPDELVPALDRPYPSRPRAPSLSTACPRAPKLSLVAGLPPPAHHHEPPPSRSREQLQCEWHPSKVRPTSNAGQRGMHAPLG